MKDDTMRSILEVATFGGIATENPTRTNLTTFFRRVDNLATKHSCTSGSSYAAIRTKEGRRYAETGRQALREVAYCILRKERR